METLTCRLLPWDTADGPTNMAADEVLVRTAAERGMRTVRVCIEEPFAEHSRADAVVTAREDSLGEKRLVGYVISRNGPPSTTDLRDFAKTKLPLFMVPAQFVVLKQFPLTPNGKIDVRHLPAPDTAVLQ